MIIESGFLTTYETRLILGYFNLFVLGISLFELALKFFLHASKKDFIHDEYGDFVFTNLLFFVTLYALYIHLFRLELPLHPTILLTPHAPHIILLRCILLISVFVQFKEFNRILLGLKIQPVQLLVGGFALLVTIGTLLLQLPQASHTKTSIIDALFTSTSATCVTGLITLDTGTHFTLLGHVIILFLIQIGGIGIMTLSAFLALLLMGRFGIEGRKIMSEAIEIKEQHFLYNLLKQIVTFTLVSEIIGASILTWRFYVNFGDLSKALYYGIFHAISAFCNAGFSLFSNNLMSFQTDPYVLLTIAFLVILGGIGFLVIADIVKYSTEDIKKHRIHHFTAQTKMVLSLTIFLLVFGTVLIFFTEREGELSSLSLPYQILNSFFQSVTPRTAGFNFLDTGLLSPATLLIVMMLMIIGGGSGSTAGGIKVNTLGILFGLLRAIIQGKSKVVMFERTLYPSTLYKAIAVSFLSLSITIVGTFLILVYDNFPFIQTIFEAISAFNTVGLSMGITPQLSVFSKVVISLLMFIGRVGPVTFAVALTQREQDEKFIQYPHENMLVG